MKLLSVLAIASCLSFNFVNAIPVFDKRQIGGNSTRAAGNRPATAEEVESLKYYMTLAGNAYCSTVIPGGKWDCGNCDRTKNMEIVKLFTTPKHDTNAMVVRDDERKRIISVFRGSVSTANFQADMDNVLINYPGAQGTRVHRGFWNSYNEVSDQIVAVVKQQVEQYPDYSLYSTGHSLGGCTSTLHALDLHQQGFNVTLYSNASPRIGNRAFAEYASKAGFPYYRLTNKRDIFVDYPYRILGFIHGGEEYWIQSNNQIVVCPNGLETNDCYNSGFGIENVNDHLQ
ncbi:Alpha/Beta hydrolase protein [Phascolomyces articulosus]|uniref:Alpha/Beta hydrolase protein n=1 Tax=Phascolomyces articulosus TaxID=60185 RepID=A0AAD5KHQ2_9FUNG|nr:Alpha/Beta hydrolase protein [Phascolomyces articulosus]